MKEIDSEDKLHSSGVVHRFNSCRRSGNEDGRPR